ncbi:hypothetical protein Vadar_028630 [Vaccinium darrowii]|uniref:Uncharacterized protein n=1 Tax=Vaccinium darrowii TaxID=229202 RepID=A0ACB7Z749_9ERIC|nr:hypothetical protein Vadar_028630 [Vaccinium darrowii]
MSKSHIHELRNRLYNVTKTGTMDEYIDEIRNHAHRLDAVGHHVDDDDLVFYTLNGLPVEEFRNLKTAVRTRGDVTFEELTTILHSEEIQIHKHEASSSAKVFVTTEKGSSGAQNATPDITTNGLSTNMAYSSQLQMFQPQNTQGAYYPQNAPTQNRNTGYDNRGRGRNTGYGQRNPCQICGKSNHTAYSCYQRQNLNFQPPSFVNTGSGRSNSQTWNGGNQNGYGGFHGSDTGTSGYGKTQVGCYGMPPTQGGCVLFGNSQPSGFYGMPGVGFNGGYGMPGVGFNGYMSTPQGSPGMGFNGGYGIPSFVSPQNQGSQFIRPVHLSLESLSSLNLQHLHQ